LLENIRKYREAYWKRSVAILTNPIICLTVVVFCLLIFGQQAPKQELALAYVGQKIGFDQDESVLYKFPQVLVSQNSFKQLSPVNLIKTSSLAIVGSIQDQRKEPVEYEVKQGDSLSSIAEDFDISLNTILWANSLSSKSTVSPGKKLIILPVSGVSHLVQRGESLSYLATAYKVASEEIISVNAVTDDKIYMGDLLIIPGGKPLPKAVIHYAPLASSYFICPISSPCRVTQRLHWYNAIDFANGTCGEPVFAAAGGVVQKTGYHSVAGKYTRILHPNGVTTFYGHFSGVLVYPGQQVSQGQLIGYSGQTGWATGCHVHFEVRGAKNPYAY